MKVNDNNENSLENRIPSTEADIKKARLVESIIERAEKNEEEEDKGRS